MLEHARYRVIVLQPTESLESSRVRSSDLHNDVGLDTCSARVSVRINNGTSAVVG